MKKNLNEWRDYYDATNPQEMPLPAPYNEVSEMLKLIILKSMRPDKLVPAVRVSKFIRVLCVMGTSHLICYQHRRTSPATWTGRLWSRRRSIWALRSRTARQEYRWYFCFQPAPIPWPVSLCSPNNATCTKSKLINVDCASYFHVSSMYAPPAAGHGLVFD